MSVAETMKCDHDLELLPAETVKLREKLAGLQIDFRAAMALAGASLKTLERKQEMLDGAALGLACACQGIVAAIDQTSADDRLVAHLRAQLARLEAMEANASTAGAILALKEVLRSGEPPTSPAAPTFTVIDGGKVG